MPKQEVQVLGLCRWSYPSEPTAFRLEATSTQEVRAKLYDPARLDLRLFFLQHVVLPGLDLQTDRNFTLILLMGDQLPDPWRSRVLELVADIPQIKPVFEPEGQIHREVCNRVMREHRDTSAKVVAEFRLDDDDAVACEFVALTRAEFAKMRPLFFDVPRLALDFARGYVLDATAQGVEVQPIVVRGWTPGLVLYTRPQNQTSLLDFPHLDTWKRMDTMTWQRVPMFVRGAHSDNDSALSQRIPVGDDFDPEQAEVELEVRFGIDLRRLRAAWSALQGGDTG